MKASGQQCEARTFIYGNNARACLKNHSRNLHAPLCGKAFFKRALEAIDLPGEIIKSGSTKKASTFCYMIIVIACTTTRLSITIIVSHILQLRL